MRVPSDPNPERPIDQSPRLTFCFALSRASLMRSPMPAIVVGCLVVVGGLLCV